MELVLLGLVFVHVEDVIAGAVAEELSKNCGSSLDTHKSSIYFETLSSLLELRVKFKILNYMKYSHLATIKAVVLGHSFLFSLS